jgi:hypothetical protein
MSNKAILLKVEDWEGLYINGELVQEGHTLNEGTSRVKYFIKLAKKYNFKIEDMEELYCTEEDEESVMDWGNFPKNIKDLKGVY